MSAHADEFQDLGGGLYHWSVYEPEVKCEIGCVALNLDGKLIVIDPVPLAKEAWAELVALAPLRAILLTNGNHLRDAVAMRAQYQAPIVSAPDTSREFAGHKPDIVLLPGELLYGITAIPIPGATPGETAFYARTGVMILGDAIINTSLEKGIEFLPDKYCSDAKQNRASLRKLLSFDFHTLTFAHGAPITSKAKEKLSALLASPT